MNLTGTIAIAAPRPAVWSLVVDPVGLAACVPGVHEVRQVDDRTFEGSISAAVGPMNGDFAFTSVIERADMPDALDVRVEGIDSVTRSRLEAHVQATLTEDGAGTVLGYRATIRVKGRLAILGEMVLRATASLMIAQVTRCLQSRLETVEAAEAAKPAVES